MMGGDVQAASLLAGVAPVLHERTRAVRVLLDHLSAAVGQTLPAGPLRTTIMGNLGAWLRRSYAAFDPASGWNYDALLRHAAAGTLVNGKDAAKILNDARAYLRAQNPLATAQQIESDLRDLMDRDVWERELTGSGAKKSTSSLMRRKDIAPRPTGTASSKVEIPSTICTKTAASTKIAARRARRETAAALIFHHNQGTRKASNHAPRR